MEPRKFLTVPTSDRHPSLSWANSIQSPRPPPTSWRSILILSSHLHLGLPNGLFPSGFPSNTHMDYMYEILFTRILHWHNNIRSHLIADTTYTLWLHVSASKLPLLSQFQALNDAYLLAETCSHSVYQLPDVTWCWTCQYNSCVNKFQIFNCSVCTKKAVECTKIIITPERSLIDQIT